MSAARQRLHEVAQRGAAAVAAARTAAQRRLRSLPARRSEGEPEERLRRLTDQASKRDRRG